MKKARENFWQAEVQNQTLNAQLRARRGLANRRLHPPTKTGRKLRDVVDAQGGMSRTARLAGLNRESLYRQLSRRGNPGLNRLNAVLTTLGLKLRFAVG